MKWLVGLVLLAAFDSPSLAMDRAAAQSRAVAGEEAYVAGDYATAIQEFSAARELGLDHPIIDYNLGNALFKHGSIGRAIASYQRALRKAPRDAEVRANLDHARSFQRDEGLGLTVPVFLRPLQFVYGRLSLNEWASVGVGQLFLLSALGILGQWGIVPRPLLRRLAIGVTVIAVCSFLATGVRYRSEVIQTSAVVVAEEVMVRSGPGADYKLTFEIHEGLTVYVSQQRGDWCQINLGGDFVGWVPTHDLEIL